MQTNSIHNLSDFMIEYSFFDENHETQIAMIIDGKNILSFKRKGTNLTTRWNLDDLSLWLRDFLNNIGEDSYPVDTEGEFASEKDISAREFDSEDDDEFDAYYDKLDDWNMRHRWHPASNGAILADLYFQLVGENVEISWNNEDPEDDVIFDFVLGGCRIPKEKFIKEVDSFLKAYAMHWF